MSRFNVWAFAAVGISALIISACGGTGSVPTSSPRPYPVGHSLPKGGGSAIIGQPYIIKGVRYVPRRQDSYDKVGLASWYGPGFHGRKTANGETFDSQRLTAAHKTLPLPSYLEVTNLENGRRLVVRANDRGPFVDGRIVDLSQRAARLLGYESQGFVRARVRYLGPAPLSGDDAYEERIAAALSKDHGRMAQAPAKPSDCSFAGRVLFWC